MRDLGTSAVARVVRRLAHLVRRRDSESRMDDEMRHHLECEAADHIRRGMSPEAAWDRAKRNFGGVERHKDDARDSRGTRFVEETVRDSGYAIRVLKRHPAFSLAVVTTFALGVGMTTAIASVVYGILMKPLPYERPDELVTLWERNIERGADRNVSSVRAFEAWRTNAHVFNDVAALVLQPLTLDGAPATRLKAIAVSPTYFTMLGVRAALGRTFEPGDDTEGGAPVALLSDALWQSRFGGDRSIVGRTISIDQRRVTIVGVMGADFEPPRFGWIADQPLWVPFAATEQNRHWGRFLHIVARVRSEVTLGAATTALAALSARLATEDHDQVGWSSALVPLRDAITGDVRTPILVLFAAVTLLLAMSTVNVASLVSSFSTTRRRELAVRRTLGATTGRLMRQQLALSFLLGAVGMVAGVFVAMVATRGIRLWVPSDVPRLANVGVDGRLMLFLSLVSLTTTIAFGLAAARRGAGTSRTRRARLDGSWVVGAETSIGLVLTVLAILMLRSFERLRAVDLGFDTSGLASARITLPDARYPTATQQAAFFDALLERVRSMPEVASASIATSRPFACCAPVTPVHDPARPVTLASSPVSDVRYVDDSYFATMHTTVLGGRVFSNDVRADGPVDAVVSRSLATTLWGTTNPIGRTIALPVNGNTTARVIGVVGDVHLVDARTPVRPTVYVSVRGFPSTERDVVVRARASGTDATLHGLAALRAAVAEIDSHVPLYQVTTFDDAVANTLARDRATTMVLSVFSIVSLALAAVGVFGILSTEVRRRRKDIGIRLALGARSWRVVLHVIDQALRPTVVGVGVGVLAALAVARFMSAMVFGVTTWDPVSFVAVAGCLLGTAVLAALLPAMRAARVSPLEAIRLD